jgi:hypothetical protein
MGLFRDAIISFLLMPTSPDARLDPTLFFTP